MFLIGRVCCVRASAGAGGGSAAAVLCRTASVARPAHELGLADVLSRLRTREQQVPAGQP